MKTMILILCLVTMCLLALAVASADALGPIRSAGITPQIDADGFVQAVGYHSTGRHVVSMPPDDSPWIWSAAPGGDAPAPRTALTCFRGVIDLPAAPTHVDAWISADKHYRLWINGEIVSRGPADAGADYPGGKSKGDSGVYFCDFVNIAHHHRPSPAYRQEYRRC